MTTITTINLAIRYGMGWVSHTTIPAGTRCTPATNLPPDPGGPLYWAEPWPGMSDVEQSWQRNYGFLIYAEQVTAYHDTHAVLSAVLANLPGIDPAALHAIADDLDPIPSNIAAMSDDELLTALAH